MGRPGDTGNRISDYRGLARRQPVLALAFAVLLLGQAGMPFTTGFLAKLEVIEASIADQGYTLAAVAMLSAAVAAFFYLRLAVTMFSPVGMEGDLAEVGTAATSDQLDLPPVPGAGPADEVASLQVLTDAPPEAAVAARGRVVVPGLTAVAIGTCVAFSVVFGIFPGPVLDFARQATLLLG